MKIAHTIAAAAVLSLGISAHGQTQQSWKVNVPFDFTVRQTNLQAGQYNVQQFGAAVTLTSKSGKTANVLTNTDYVSQPFTHSSLVFKKNGGEYSLAQIKNAGSNTEFDAIVSKHVPRLEADNSSQLIEVAALGTR